MPKASRAYSLLVEWGLDERPLYACDLNRSTQHFGTAMERKTFRVDQSTNIAFRLSASQSGLQRECLLALMWTDRNPGS